MKLLKEINKEETGQTFILVLIMLLLGGLIIASLLGYMSTGLNVGRVFEERMDELYAADSGVEDALWQIITKADELPQAGDDPPTWGYSINPINGKVFVDENPSEYPHPIIITYIDETTYKIESTATSTDTDPITSTSIESYINTLEFDFFLDNAITSKGIVYLKGGGGSASMVYDGDVVYCEEPAPDQDQVINGQVKNECVDWPTADDMSAFYLQNLQDNPPYTVYPDGTKIDVSDIDDIGPLYCEGNLTIETTSADEHATLQGTVYVAGNLDFKQSGKIYYIHLNGHTIYVDGYGYEEPPPQPNINFPSDKCYLEGPGCIIARHDIDFHPSQEGTEFIFVMSIEGTTFFHPGATGGTFYGSLAGNTLVDLHPGYILSWIDPPDDLILPGAEGQPNVISEIRTWEISLA